MSLDTALRDGIDYAYAGARADALYAVLDELNAAEEASGSTPGSYEARYTPVMTGKIRQVIAAALGVEQKETSK